MIAGDPLVILDLLDMQELTPAAQTILLEDVTQGQFHLGIGRIEDAHIEAALTQDLLTALLMVQGAEVEAHMGVEVLAADGVASPLGILSNNTGNRHLFLVAGVAGCRTDMRCINIAV